MIPAMLQVEYEDDGVYLYRCLMCKAEMSVYSAPFNFCPACGIKIERMIYAEEGREKRRSRRLPSMDYWSKQHDKLRQYPQSYYEIQEYRRTWDDKYVWQELRHLYNIGGPTACEGPSHYRGHVLQHLAILRHEDDKLYRAVIVEGKHSPLP